jgi:decaprenylphospho-beta-D-erythro-pentofuranosid-2-ulose 2-reductase
VREIELNGVATVALVLHAASRFEARGAGAIAVVTSVAGVRGRASNFVYGSAKALVSTLLAGLRHRLHRKGIAVVDIRPGFVDTPMTAAFTKGALWASPARVARDIVAAIDRRAGVVYTPWFWRWIMLVIRHVPEFLFVRTKL